MNVVAFCSHVAEAEWLFVAYSTFCIQSVKWEVARDDGAAYHEIELEVCEDNAEESMHLPTAPWC